MVRDLSEKRSARSLAVPQSLVVWGLGNCIMFLVVMLMPKILEVGSIQKLFFLNVAIWVLAAIYTQLMPLRLPLFLIFAVLLHLWFSFATLYSELTLAYAVPQNGLDFVPGLYVLAFLQGFGVAYVRPDLRKYFCKALIVVGCISAVVGVLQFVGVGAAQAYGYWIMSTDVEAADKTFDTVRGNGIMVGISYSVVWTMVPAMLLGSMIRERGIKWFEPMLILVLFAGAIVVQVRNLLPLVAFVAITMFVLAYQRYRIKAIWVGIPAVMAAIGLLLVNVERLGYLFSGSTATLEWRREVLWPQAWAIFRQYPWTGIGVEPAFTSWLTQPSANRFLSYTFLDNGWLLALIWGGLPALVLIILSVGSGVIGSIRFLAGVKDPWSRVGGWAMLVLALNFLIGMFFGNQFTNPPATSFIFVFAGLVVGGAASLQRNKGEKV